MKAILVINIDEDILNAIEQERIKSGYAFVDIAHHYDEEWKDWIFHRVKLLSARPMPKPRPERDRREWMTYYKQGWNACLKELENEQM